MEAARKWMGFVLIVVGSCLISYHLVSFDSGPVHYSAMSPDPPAYFYHYPRNTRLGIASGTALLVAGLLLRRWR